MIDVKPVDVKKEEVKAEPVKSVTPKPLMDQVKELQDFKADALSGNVKVKKMKLSRKARVKGRKLKKGWIGVIELSENRVMTGTKQKIKGFAYNDSTGKYHASDGREIYFWEGKFPVIIQPTWKSNPLMIDPKSETNETYGQEYIKAKMLSDTIKVKSKGGSIILWILLAGAAIFAINYFFGGK